MPRDTEESVWVELSRGDLRRIHGALLVLDEGLINSLEQLAGRMLVWSAKLRAKRGLPRDRHELRHIEAALAAGNSEDCAQRACRLTGVSR